MISHAGSPLPDRSHMDWEDSSSLGLRFDLVRMITARVYRPGHPQEQRTDIREVSSMTVRVGLIDLSRVIDIQAH